MLINELKGRVDVIRLARWQMLAAFAMTGGAALVIGGWKTIGADEFALLAASSLFGIIIASTTYFAAIYTAGPRTTALLFTLASPFSLLLGYLFLGETIDMRQALGVGLVLAGIAMAVGLRRRDTFGNRGVGGGRHIDCAETINASLGRHRAGHRHGAWPGIGQSDGAAGDGGRRGTDRCYWLCARHRGVVSSRAGAAAVPVSGTSPTHRRSDAGIAIASAFFGTGLRHVAVDGGSGDRQCRHRDDLVIDDPDHDSSMVWLRSGVPPVTAAWIGAAIAGGNTMISL